MNMLDVRSLYVTYLSEEERVEAVRGIDFSAEEGKVTGIVGESGSGKSTAMLAVMGLLDHKAAVEAEKVSLFGNTVRAGDNAAIIFQDPPGDGRTKRKLRDDLSKSSRSSHHSTFTTYRIARRNASFLKKDYPRMQLRKALHRF